MISILVLSNNEELTSSIAEALLTEDYEVIRRQRSMPEPEIFSRIDLLILDASSSQNDVSSFINELKMLSSLLSVFVVVEQGNVRAAVDAMEAGASHALAVPVDKYLLISSIKAKISQPTQLHQDQLVIQQAIDLLQSLRARHVRLDQKILRKDESEPDSIPPNQDTLLKIGELSIHIKPQKVFYREKPINLTASQYKILLYLFQAKGHIVPFDELYFHLHDTRLDRSSARTALSSHMSYLRNKLTEVGCGDYLVNIRGRGYIIEDATEKITHTTKINLDLLLEQLPIILWTTNTELRITSILGAGLARLSVDPATLIGMKLADFLQRQDFISTMHTHHQALLGISGTNEQRVRDRILEVYVEPSFNKDDDIIGCIGLALDVTERKEAEEAYQLLVDHSVQGLTIFQNNRVIFANTTMAEITAYTVEELLALDDPLQLIYPEDQARVYENIQKRLAGEDVSAYSEYRIIRKDGAVRWLEQVSFINNFRGHAAIHTAATDRTQEKQAQEAYRQLEELYRILAKNLPKMAVLLFDHNLRYIIAEGQALEEMGYYRHKLEGRTIWEVLPPDRTDALIPYYRAALSGDENTFEWVSNDRVYEIQTLPVRKDQGQIIAGMFIIQDVTRHRRPSL